MFVNDDLSTISSRYLRIFAMWMGIFLGMHFRMDDLPRNSADLGMIIVDDFDPIIYIYTYIYTYIYIYTGIIMHIFQNSPCHYKEWCRCLLLELSLLGRISSISMDNSSPPKMPQIVISWVGRLLDKGKACGLSLGCRWIRQWQLKKNGVFTSKHWPCNQVI
jgi:hypothetical protein